MLLTGANESRGRCLFQQGLSQLYLEGLCVSHLFITHCDVWGHRTVTLRLSVYIFRFPGPRECTSKPCSVVHARPDSQHDTPPAFLDITHMPRYTFQFGSDSKNLPRIACCCKLLQDRVPESSPNRREQAGVSPAPVTSVCQTPVLFHSNKPPTRFCSSDVPSPRAAQNVCCPL